MGYNFSVIIEPNNFKLTETIYYASAEAATGGVL